MKGFSLILFVLNSINQQITKLNRSGWGERGNTLTKDD